MTDGNRGSSSRPSRLSPPLTPSEQERLWCACSLWYVRERLVLALLLEMGLRPREACSLSFHDIQPGELSVLGKDWHMRTVSLGNETKLALDRYLASAFSRDRRRQDEHAALLGLDEAGLADQVRALGQRAGLDHPLSVHRLRRTAIHRAWTVHRKEDGE
jgi:site-specific recombinase XerD